MKKADEKTRKWLFIHATNSLRRRLRTRPIRYRPGRYIRGEVRIRAPSTLCLSRNFVETVQFIDKVFGFIPKSRTFVDFRPIKSVSPDAVLLLTATLDMWQRLKGVTLHTRHTEGWSPQVTHVFRSLGLFDLLKTPGISKKPIQSLDNIQILKLSSGEGADGSLANELTNSLQNLAGGVEEQSLYVGLTEAMTNSSQHAYPRDLMKGVPENFMRWWMTGSFDQGKGSLRILILDLGVGIPQTLPRSSIAEKVAGLLARYTSPDDADRIDAAVQVGRTSTTSRGRGNGLDDIRKIVEDSQNGRLRILSGHGEVLYTTGNVHPKKTTHAVSIPGTLIEWEICR